MANESRSLLCKPVVNFYGQTYRTSVSDANRITSVVDRRNSTHSTDSVFVLDTVRDSANSNISHVYIKGKNISRIQITGVGTIGANINQLVSAYSVQDAQGRNKPFEIDGFQHFLFELKRGVSPNEIENWIVSRLTITITGTNKQTYEIAALEKVLAFDSQKYYRQLAYNNTWRGSVTHEHITGRLKRVPPINQEPQRWRVQMALKNRFMNETPIGQDLNNFFRNYPNFAFVPEYSRWADRVFTEALLENPDVQLRFLGDNTESYEMLTTILEA